VRGFLDDDADDDAVRRGQTGAPVEVALTLHHETERAWAVSDGGAVHWLPKSMATRGDGREEFTWTMPEWLANARGWL